ncbi:MAG: DUF3784 domain-containing protein [Clostridiaceae bacterium]|nr:DUF3784 domain-containing protein [Clostridiaceae bacterium]
MSGYNTASKEKQAKYDIEKLTKYFGNLTWSNEYGLERIETLDMDSSCFIAIFSPCIVDYTQLQSR